jgi:hypothetical protein
MSQITPVLKHNLGISHQTFNMDRNLYATPYALAFGLKFAMLLEQVHEGAGGNLQPSVVRTVRVGGGSIVLDSLHHNHSK